MIEKEKSNNMLLKDKMKGYKRKLINKRFKGVSMNMKENKIEENKKNGKEERKTKGYF